MRDAAKRGVGPRGPAPRFYLARIALAALALAASALAASGCIEVHVPLFGGGPGKLEERVVQGRKGPKILLLEVSGALSTRAAKGLLGLPAGESVVARVREELERAAQDDEIAALLLRIDSPGGSVIASDIVYREILRHKRETGRPVVAQLMGVAASGGYYVAMAADHVQAYPATITGSIGVIAMGFNVSGLMDKLGVQYQAFTTGAFKDAGTPFRAMSDAERAQLASVTQDLFEGFLDVVERGRPKLDRTAIERLADGRIYTARQALALGLIDDVGDLPECVEATKRAAGISGDARVIVYHRPGERPENLFSAQSLAGAPAASAPEAGGSFPESLGEPSFLYWWPGAGAAALTGALAPIQLPAGLPQ